LVEYRDAQIDLCAGRDVEEICRVVEEAERTPAERPFAAGAEL
jgi:hypothetical protein